METYTCTLCTRSRTSADACGLRWSSQHEPGGVIAWICPVCTRANLGRIETGLPLAPVDGVGTLPLRAA